MQSLIVFFYILISITLIALILLQQGKGSDIGSAFGGGSTNTMFGPNSSISPLTKITSILALLFLVLSVTITLQSRSIVPDAVLEEEVPEQTSKGVLPDTIPQ